MGGSVYDQFSLFRSKTIESYQQQCARLPEFSLADRSDPLNSVQSMTCNDMGTVVILMELDGTQFKLRKLFGVPFVTDSGIFPLLPTDRFANLFTDLTNLGEEPGIFELQPKSCCMIDASGGCTTSITIDNANVVQHLVDPHDTKRYLFPLSADVVANKKGACDFDIVQHGVLETSVRIEFLATRLDPVTPGGSSNVPSLLDPIDYDGQTNCVPPNRIVINQGILMCQSPCTLDQTVQLNGQCTAQNCTAKYGGSRNFYNQATGICEAAVLCVGDRVYNPTQNTCSNPSSSTPPSSSSPPSPGSTPTIPSFSPAPSPPDLYNPTEGSNTIDCGSHGKATSSGKSCVCDSGWATNANQDMFAFVWCSVPTVPSVIPPGTNGTTPTNTNAATSIFSKLVAGNNKYVLVGVVVAVGLCCLCGSGILFYFRKRLPCYNNLMTRFNKFKAKSQTPKIFSDRPAMYRELHSPVTVASPYVSPPF
jgi:hypothetical protein